MGTKLAQIVSPDSDIILMEEGAETEEFWVCLGGYGEYSTKHLWVRICVISS